VPTARLDTITLDLGSLASVRSAAAELRSRRPRVDVLINNAGVMWAPKGKTADGFEPPRRPWLRIRAAREPN